MQTCPDCGGRNESGELFCGSCGAYLEWEQPQAAVSAPVAAAPVAAAPVVAAPVAASDEGAGRDASAIRVKTTDARPEDVRPPEGAAPRPQDARAQEAGDPPAPEAATAPAVDAAPAEDAAPAVPAVPAVPAEDAAPAAPATEPAAPAQAAAATGPRRPAPEARQPAARRPGVPAPRRPVPAEAEEDSPRPGELICGACGVGNGPHRKFCRRCGASLADAPVQPERSWWRRVLRPERRAGPKAGARPRYRRRRFPTGAVVTILVLGLLGGAAWYFRDTLAGAYDAVLDRVAGNDPVNPNGIDASSARDDRPASNVRDGLYDTPWSPAGEGRGEWIEFTFAEPYRLVRINAHGGVSPEDVERLAEARPQRVRLTVQTSTGQEVQDVTMSDAGGVQSLPVAVSDVEAVRLTILSVYGAELQMPVSFGEVEFQGRQ